MPYRPDIDGLRALAVTLVLLYHTGLGVPGGFTGVDVFFVISGYLISNLLRKEIAAGTFSTWRFWERRVRRLIPALLVMTLATAGLGVLLLLPADLYVLGRCMLAQPVLAANMYLGLALEHGYFFHPAESLPLLHTWSLAVEEQFYLVFPFLLLLLHRTGRGARFAPGLILWAAATFEGSVVCGSWWCWSPPICRTRRRG